jgi:hypothetical protein
MRPFGTASGLPSLFSVFKDLTDSAETFGQARLADGVDFYTVFVTIHDSQGLPVIGLTKNLTISASASLNLTDIVDSGLGVYTFEVTSMVPGNYTLVVMLDNGPIDEPLPLNFIWSKTNGSTVFTGTTLMAEGLTGGGPPSSNTAIIVLLALTLGAAVLLASIARRFVRF